MMSFKNSYKCLFILIYTTYKLVLIKWNTVEIQIGNRFDSNYFAV